jgi:DNA-directed RNA polymerase subunit RPC12/RpoP
MSDENLLTEIIRCPNCACKLRYRSQTKSSKIKCPKCNSTIVLPPGPPANKVPIQRDRGDDWFVKLIDDVEFGPFSFDQIRDFVVQGRIVAETMVRQGNQTNSIWVRSDTVPSLIRTLKENQVTDSSCAVPLSIPIEPQRTIKHSRPKKSMRISTILAFGMFGCTLLLPIAMIALFLYLSVASNIQKRPGSEIEILPGHTISEGSDGLFTYETPSEKEAKVVGHAIGTFLSSLCFPVIPYVLIMLILGSAYFAFRSAGN